MARQQNKGATMITITRARGINGVTYYRAWEPSTIGGHHHTITFIDGVCYGRIGTDPDSTHYEDLAVGTPERSQAVARAYAERYDAAYRTIIAEHPHAATGKHDSGEIVVTEES